MDATAAIALAAVLISALTFVAVQFGARRTATAGYVHQLEQRVVRLEQELESKTLRVQELEETIVRLTQRLINAEGRNRS